MQQKAEGRGQKEKVFVTKVTSGYNVLIFASSYTWGEVGIKFSLSSREPLGLPQLSFPRLSNL